MTLTIICVIMSIGFSLIILIPQYKNPISQLVSYPTAIRKRVESLSEYKDIIKKIKQKSIGKKIFSIIVFAVILAIISFFLGGKTFFQTFKYSIIIFMAVNFYDLIVMDIIVFCHSKKLMIKGTEDMIKEYRNPGHHVIGFLKGTGIGIIVALLSGGIVALYNIIK